LEKNDRQSSCKNVFKNKDKEKMKEIFTDRWLNIIKSLEQAPRSTAITEGGTKPC